MPRNVLENSTSKSKTHHADGFKARYDFYTSLGLTHEQSIKVAMVYTKEARHKLFLMYTQGVCQFCGSKENLTIDHIIPVSITKKRRKSDLTNKQLLCYKCNTKKSNKVL